MGDPKFLDFLLFGDPKLPAEFPKPLELNFHHQNGRGWRVMRREAMLLSAKCSVASRCRGLSEAMMPTASAALHPDLSLPDAQRKTGCWPHCKMLVIHYKPCDSLSKNALWQPPLPICYLRQVVDNPQVLHCRQCLVGGLEHEFYFPIYWECHHPNWRTPSFFRGVGLNHQPDVLLVGFRRRFWCAADWLRKWGAKCLSTAGRRHRRDEGRRQAGRANSDANLSTKGAPL